MAERTTLICMLYDTDAASAVVRELRELGLSGGDVGVVRDARTDLTATATLKAMRVQDGDLAMLTEGLRRGGTVIAVRAEATLAGRVEEIFTGHRAGRVDEKVMETDASVDPVVLVTPVGPMATHQFVHPAGLKFDTVEQNRLDSESDTDAEPDSVDRT